MTIEEAKRLADDIDAAARTLNSAIAEASKAGLSVDITMLYQTKIGGNDVPFVQATAKIAPRSIEA